MGRRILIADDSITIQKVVELTFSEFDDEVVSVGNGALASQALGQGPFDIALLDTVMPERTGYDLCAEIRKNDRLAWMPVVLLSGTFEPFDEARARQVGADGHIRKPFESRSLMAQVEDLVAAKPRPGAPPATARPRPRPVAPAPPAPAPAAPAPPRAPAPPPAAQGPRPAPAVSTVSPAAPPKPAPAAASIQTPPRPAAAPAAAPAPASPAPQPARPAPTPAADAGRRPQPAVSIPPDVLERVVREAVAAMADKVVREVAWEVIPDLAEAIIRRRIRELEDEADSRGSENG